MNIIDEWLEKTLQASLQPNQPKGMRIPESSSRHKKSVTADNNDKASPSFARQFSRKNDVRQERQATVSALQQLQFDRDSLTNLGLDKTAQDKIYRSIYVHCHGIQEMIQSFKCMEPQVCIKLWEIFVMLFQYYDPNLRASFMAFILENQDKRLVAAMNSLQSQMDETWEENQKLRNDHLNHQVNCSSAVYELQMISTSNQVLTSSFQQKIADQQLTISEHEKYIANLSSLLTDSQQCLAVAEQVLNSLGVAHTASLQENAQLTKQLSNLEKENLRLSTRLSQSEQSNRILREDYNKLRDEFLIQQRETATLQEQCDHLVNENNIHKQHIHETEKKLRDMMFMERQAFDSVASSSHTIHALITSLQSFMTASDELGYVARLTHGILHDSRLHLAQSIPAFTPHVHLTHVPDNITQATDTDSSDETSRLDFIHHFNQQLNNWDRVIPRLKQECFSLSQQQVLAEVVQILINCGFDLITLREKHETLSSLSQISILSGQTMSDIMLTTAKTLRQESNERQSFINQQQVKITRLQEILELARNEIGRLRPFEGKYTELEAKFVQIVAFYKQAVKDKTAAEQLSETLSYRVAQLEITAAKVPQLESVASDLQAKVEEREAYIQFMQEEHRNGNDRRKTRRASQRRNSGFQGMNGGNASTSNSGANSRPVSQQRRSREGGGGGGGRGDRSASRGTTSRGTSATNSRRTSAHNKDDRNSSFATAARNAVRIASGDENYDDNYDDEYFVADDNDDIDDDQGQDADEEEVELEEEEFDEVDAVISDCFDSIKGAVLSLAGIASAALQLHCANQRLHQLHGGRGALTTEGNELVMLQRQAEEHLKEVADQRDNLLYTSTYKLRPAQQEQVLALFDTLIHLPEKLMSLMTYADEVYDLRGEVKQLQLEVDRVKLYSSKERVRIIKHYEDQLFDFRHLITIQTYS